MSPYLRKASTSALALFMALSLSGGHWVVLQVTAWSGMIVSRTMEKGVGEALATTFDGDHPCPMCKAIKRTQDSEQKPVFPTPAKNAGKLKLDTTLCSGLFLITPPATSGDLDLPDMTPATIKRSHKPAVPPPRLAA